MDVYSAELQDFIKKLTKDEFIADFINYENTLKVSAKDDESTEGKQPEVAENDQMDIDSEEMDNDQKENAEDVVENEDEDVIIEGATEDGVLDAGDASLLASFLDTSNINGEPVQQAGEEELDDKLQQTMIEKESTVDALDPVLQL